MNAKKPIPVWAVVVAIAAALGLAAAVLFTLNPSNDKDALVRGRMKPGTSAAVSQPDPSHYGLPRGTPVIHTDGNQMVDPRRKPQGQ